MNHPSQLQPVILKKSHPAGHISGIGKKCFAFVNLFVHYHSVREQTPRGSKQE
jgi:hypothetical protein